jgi:hypothetical protein
MESYAGDAELGHDAALPSFRLRLIARCQSVNLERVKDDRKAG